MHLDVVATWQVLLLGGVLHHLCVADWVCSGAEGAGGRGLLVLLL